MNIISSLSQSLSAILSAITGECEDSLRDTDLRATQLPYLLCVCRNPGLSQDGLAGRLGVNRSNVTRQMTELEGLGYVRRRRNPQDGREWLVEPTDRAYEVLPRLLDALSDAQAVLMRDMSGEEQELLVELAERVAKNAARRAAERAREER